MSRPLIISDCDEVLLHMLVPFRHWLDMAHHIHFDFGTPFEEAFRHKYSAQQIGLPRMRELLNAFFDTEMARQYAIEGALPALARLSDMADVVILTNLLDRHRDRRIAQLAAHGAHYPVFTNQGGKGRAVARLIAERRPSVTFFVDDIEGNHESVARHVPQVWRIHMVGEPELAPMIPVSAAAHCRIDDWAAAEAWIRDRIVDLAATLSDDAGVKA